MPSETRSLRRKLLTWLLLPLLILFFLRAGYNYYYGNRLSDRVYDRLLLTLANSLAQQIVYDSPNARPVLPPATPRILLADEYDSIYFAVRNEQGQIVLGEQRMPPAPVDFAAQERSFSDGRIYDRNVRVANLRINMDDRVYTLQVAETRTKRSMLSQEFQTGVILPQMLIIVLATIIVWVGIGKSLAPLKRLQAAVSQRSHRDLSPLSGQDVPAEVQPLVHAINELMARLSETLDVQNRFIADAAHQLRTPLAGLKAQIELAQRQRDPAALNDFLPALRTSAERMSRLVGQLLALARNGPEAEPNVPKDRIDLGVLTRDIARAWVPRALDQHIDLGFEAPPVPVFLLGDAARLKDLLDNLLDNAVRYGGPGGQITVAVYAEDDRACLTVTDTGPGIPPEQRERVFERFYSLLGQGVEGSGLGLAIVQEIARMHNGVVAIETGPHGIGARVKVVFEPASKA